MAIIIEKRLNVKRQFGLFGKLEGVYPVKQPLSEGGCFSTVESKLRFGFETGFEQDLVCPSLAKPVNHGYSVVL
jgi:hypothetical protein